MKTEKTEIMTISEAKNLIGLDKTMYETAYDFHMKYVDTATEDSAHEAGLKEINRINAIIEEGIKPQKYVNLSTGETFMATENELESRNEY